MLSIERSTDPALLGKQPKEDVAIVDKRDRGMTVYAPGAFSFSNWSIRTIPEPPRVPVRGGFLCDEMYMRAGFELAPLCFRKDSPACKECWLRSSLLTFRD